MQFLNPTMWRWTGSWSTQVQTVQKQQETGSSGSEAFLLAAARRRSSSFSQVRKSLAQCLIVNLPQCKSVIRILFIYLFYLPFLVSPMDTYQFFIWFYKDANMPLENVYNLLKFLFLDLLSVRKWRQKRKLVRIFKRRNYLKTLCLAQGQDSVNASTLSHLCLSYPSEAHFHHFFSSLIVLIVKRCSEMFKLSVPTGN